MPPKTRRSRGGGTAAAEPAPPAAEVKVEVAKPEEPVVVSERSTEPAADEKPVVEESSKDETPAAETEAAAVENGESNDAPPETDNAAEGDGDVDEDAPEGEASGGDEDSAKKTDKEKEEEKEKRAKVQLELDEKARTYVVAVVGYVTYADFGLSELKQPLQKSTAFETRFVQDGEVKKGFVTMYFTKSWDAYLAIDKLRGLDVPRDDGSSTYSCWLLDRKNAHAFMHQENVALRQLRTQLNANNENDPSLRSLFIANIPKSATKELLMAIFAEAQDIVLPLVEPGKNKGYCYIEFSEAEKLDEYMTKYQDIKIEDGEVSAKIIIRKIGNVSTDADKERTSRQLKARARQQLPDLGKKSSPYESRTTPRSRGSSSYRGSSRNERFNRPYRPRGGYRYGDSYRDSQRQDQGAATLAALQQLLSQQPLMQRGSGGFRGQKRRFDGPYDDYGAMSKAPRRAYDHGPMGMMEGGSSQFYEDNYDGWGASSFQSGGYGGDFGDGNRRRKGFRGGGAGKFKRN